ncbi:hypothetical protein SLS60_000685 [Paraconiothyrium brasiliense]|uniref:Uncharacterized protein n=1 Tax=Paraconiothyrium brasiliense TaxID=300254 RepID=A0ABR3S6Y2_9PLEO
MLDAHDAAAFDKANCTSAWEKPDYQTIKECGWKDENVLEDNHRPSISGPGVFNGVKDVLNGCGRVNAMTVGDNMPGPNDGLHRSNRCSRRRQESIDIYHKEDVDAGLLSDYEDDRRIVSGRESNSTSLATRQRFIACEESSVSGNSDERDGSEESDDGSPSSDGDSTDAIDYYGSGADDSNDEIGSDDPLDDEIIHNYDDDECY